MNILLLSMPDSFEHMPTIGIRMPNGALASLAGNVDPHHRVSVADLILAQRRVPETVAKLVQELQPHVVGLSVMTFQRKTALKIIELVRCLRPGVHIVVGGYDPSLAVEAYAENCQAKVDFAPSTASKAARSSYPSGTLACSKVTPFWDGRWMSLKLHAAVPLTAAFVQ